MELIIVFGWLLSTTNGEMTPPIQPAYSGCVSNVKCKCARDNVNQLTVDCSKMNLTEIPRMPDDTVFLNLNDNEIAEIDKGTFSNLPNLLSLDLSNNYIRNIDRHGFQEQKKLRRLDLSHNYVSLTAGGFEPGVFRSLTNLCYLSIQNAQQRDTSSYPDETFSDMLALTTLKIDGKRNAIFGEGFAKLQTLYMLKLSSDNCNMHTVYNNTFAHLPSLTVLDISRCYIHVIEPGALIPLRQLQYLDISNNVALSLDGLRNASFGLINGPISVLKANKLYPDFHLSVQLNNEHLEFLDQTNIKELFLDENQIELIDSNSGNICPKSMVKLSIIDNKFIFGFYIFQAYTCKSLKIFHGGYQHTTHIPYTQTTELKHVPTPIEDCTLMYNIESCKHDINKTICIDKNDEHIRKFLSNSNISGDLRSTEHSNSIPSLKQYSKSMPSVIQSISLPAGNSNKQNINSTHVSEKTTDFSDKGISFNVPPMLEEFHFQFADLKYEIPKIKFINGSVKFINVSGNSFYKLTGPLVGLEKLETLDVSDNLCSNVSNQFFENLKNLRSLFLGDNLFGLILMKDSEGRIFGNLSKLRTLVLSNNKISSLPVQLFSGLYSLEYLDISRNDLQILNFNMDRMKITYLNINQNQLSSLAQNVRMILTKQAKFNNVTIDLRNNPFQCDCSSFEFMKWVYNEKSQIKFNGFETYTCNVDNNNQSFIALGDLVWGFDKRCANYTVAIWILSISMILFVAVLIAGMVYRYRWKRRYLYYMTKRWYKNYNELHENDRDNYQFDAFLSYADKNLRFVKFTLLPKMETEGLHLCIHHRDFLPGEEIAANIANAIHRSRKTVVLLDDDFLSSYWCMYELNMARMESVYSRYGENILIVLLKESVDRSKLPLEIIDLIHKNTYIELPEVIMDMDIADMCRRLRDTIRD
ncbi:hypothetical protein ACJMK2_018987 [Sinanodonta woodiana]|uniref:TIR domain-containing protein n=1 Tax=Sinanodonta woodiana TaxID=1069815 RepID=A0ABD3UHT3_SINWO